MAGKGQCHRHGYQPERGHEGQMRAVLAGARTQHAAGTIYSHDRRATVFSLLHYQEIPTQSKYSMDIINLPPGPTDSDRYPIVKSKHSVSLLFNLTVIV